MSRRARLFSACRSRSPRFAYVQESPADAATGERVSERCARGSMAAERAAGPGTNGVLACVGMKMTAGTAAAVISGHSAVLEDGYLLATCSCSWLISGYDYTPVNEFAPRSSGILRSEPKTTARGSRYASEQEVTDPARVQSRSITSGAYEFRGVGLRLEQGQWVMRKPRSRHFRGVCGGIVGRKGAGKDPR